MLDVAGAPPPSHADLVGQRGDGARGLFDLDLDRHREPFIRVQRRPCRCSSAPVQTAGEQLIAGRGGLYVLRAAVTETAVRPGGSVSVIVTGVSAPLTAPSPRSLAVTMIVPFPAGRQVRGRDFGAELPPRRLRRRGRRDAQQRQQPGGTTQHDQHERAPHRFPLAVPSVFALGGRRACWRALRSACASAWSAGALCCTRSAHSRASARASAAASSWSLLSLTSCLAGAGGRGEGSPGPMNVALPDACSGACAGGAAGRHASRAGAACRRARRRGQARRCGGADARVVDVKRRVGVLREQLRGGRGRTRRCRSGSLPGTPIRFGGAGGDQRDTARRRGFRSCRARRARTRRRSRPPPFRSCR